jgi:hypothetical protein
MKALLLFLFFSIPLFCQQWNVIGNMPNPVYGGFAVAEDSLIYIIGGYSEVSQSSSKLIQAYNPETGEWSIADTMKEARYGLIAFKHSKSIFYNGGRLITQSNSGTLEKWEIPSSPQVHDDEIQFTRSFAAGQIKNNKIYVFGGSSTSPTASYMYEYNVQSGNVQYNSNLGFTIFPAQQMSVIFDDNIYLFGGASLIGVSKNIYRYNIDSRDFTNTGINLLSSRAGGSAVITDSGDIFIIGGYNESQQVLKSVEKIEINNEDISVKQGVPLNFARKELMSVVFKGDIYVFGGVNSSNDAVPQIERFTSVTGIEEPELELNFSLQQNYPNPFNPSTTIEYKLNERGAVKLSVFDLLGRETAVLIDEELEPGEYQIKFIASAELPSGIYFYKLSAGNKSSIKKMLLLK